MSAIHVGFGLQRLPPPNPTNKASPKPRPSPSPKPKPKNPTNPNTGGGLILPSSGDFPKSQPIKPAPNPPSSEGSKTNPVKSPGTLNGDNDKDIVKTNPIKPGDGKPGTSLENPASALPGALPGLNKVNVTQPYEGLFNDGDINFGTELPVQIFEGNITIINPVSTPLILSDSGYWNSVQLNQKYIPGILISVNIFFSLLESLVSETIALFGKSWRQEWSKFRKVEKHDMDIERAIKCGCADCSKVYAPIPKGFVAPWNKAWVVVKKRPRATKAPGRRGRPLHSDINAPMGAKRLSIPGSIIEEDEESMRAFNSALATSTANYADTIPDTVADMEMNIESLVHDPGLTLKRQKSKTPKWLEDATIGEIERVTGGAIKRESFGI
ncbi:Protein of unknown function [Pyronema omphalodes CBS 100304]|uniref:Uncharacterized protein n=1 Tax=Pyronema omphalodes (strain CBS 100304) TaxID=1076935 RepID=U4LJW9_PYROM|nr:Protein of unknown function [Pyronema omphalodes CBS 100304]